MIVRWTALVLAFTAMFAGLCAAGQPAPPSQPAMPKDLNGLTVFFWTVDNESICVSALANTNQASSKPAIFDFRWDPPTAKWLSDPKKCPTPQKYIAAKDTVAICDKFGASKTFSPYCSALTQAVKSIDPKDIAAISGGVGSALAHDRRFRVTHLDPDELNKIVTAGGPDWLLVGGGIAAIVVALLGLGALALYSQYKSRRLHDRTDRMMRDGIAMLSLKLEELSRRPAGTPVLDSSSPALADIERLQAVISTELQAHISAELKDGIGKVTTLLNDSLTPAMLSSLAQVPSLIEVLRGMAPPRIAEDFGSLDVLGGGQTQHVDSLVAALAQRLQAHFQTLVEELVRESRGDPSESAILASLSVQSERIGEIASRLGELENKIEKGLASAGSNTVAAAQESLLPVATTQDLDQAFRGLAEDLAAARIGNVLPEAGLRAAYDATRRIPLATQQALATLGLDPSIWEPAVRFVRAINLESLDERRLAALRPALDAFLKLALGPAVEAFVPASGERINSELHADVTGSSSFGSTDIASVQSAGVTWRGRVVLRSFVKHRVG